MIVFLILFIVLLIFILVGFYLTTRLIYPHTLTHAEVIKNELDEGRINPTEWDALSKEEVWIDSPYGYKIYGLFIPNEGAHKTVIIAHGITSTLFSCVKYIPLYFQRGFNIMLFDERHHGRSGGKNCTFGYYEKYDMRAVTEWVFNRMGGGGIVGLHGESMGASIALQSAAIDDRLAFVIADCPFSDLKKMLSYRLVLDYHLPPVLFLPVADFICTLISGMSFETVSPLRDVKYLGVPVQFIHGQEDRYIPPEMSQEMYHAKVNGIRSIFLVPGARHAESFSKNKTEYNQVVGQFLSRLGMDQ